MTAEQHTYLPLEEVVEGKRYRVAWDDCCVQGNFESVLERKNYVPNSPTDPTPFLDSLTFDNGVTVSGHGIYIEKADAADATGDKGLRP